MSKIWKKTGDSSYALFQDNHLLGSMEIKPNSLEAKAIATIGFDSFTIRRTGFWKSSISLVDERNLTLAKVYADHWYGNTSTLEFQDRKYQIVLRNNPLAAYVLLDSGEEILSYGLHAENGKMEIKTVSSNNLSGTIPDFILWYLFAPIAKENMGDEFAFLLLLTAQ